MKKLFVLITFYLAVFTFVSAQTNSIKPRTLSGCIVNGKAKNLVKPSYPAAALAVRASGTVYVKVLIGEDGKIISAEAVSGHPLLRQAAVKAALESFFSPTLLDNMPVKVSGIITYNFVTEMSFGQMGFDLGLIEKSKTVHDNVYVPNISANIPSDWEKEKEDANILSAITQKMPPVAELTDSNAKSYTDESTPIMGSKNTDGNRGSVTGGSVVKVITADEIASSLIKNIEIRLASETEKLWRFKIGTILGRILAQSEDETKLKGETLNLNKLISSAPSNISALSLENLGKLVILIQGTGNYAERKAQIIETAKKLRNL